MNEHELEEGCCGFQIHHTGECCQNEKSDTNEQTEDNYKR